MRPEPRPERETPQAARAAQAVILIFVVLNILFVMTGMLPLLAKNDPRKQNPALRRPVACLAWSDASMADCAVAQHRSGHGDQH